MPTKICTKCQSELPLDRFHSNGGGALRPYCKDCDKKDKKKRYDANPEKPIAYSREYRKNHLDHCRARDRAYNLARKEQQKNYHKVYRKKYNLTHREQINKYSSEWQRKHPENKKPTDLRRRARKQNLPNAFKQKDWTGCMNYWHGTCAYCGHQAGLFKETKITADHFIPIASIECPGTIPKNILPACRSCNSSKNNKNPIEWLVNKFGKRKANQILAQIKAYFDQLA